MLKMKTRQQLRADEKGVVTIVIAILVIMLVTLISLAYVRLANREQRQALDRQLNTQALYAAEAGINQAVSTIKTAINNGQSIPTKTDCGSDPNYTDSQIINATAKVEYTCLLVDPSPTTVEFKPVLLNQPEVFPLKTNVDINFIRIAWQDSNAPSTANGTYYDNCDSDVDTGKLPTIDTWINTYKCPAGMIRLDLVPTTGATDHDTLVSSAKTLFIRPSKDDNGSTYNSTESLDYPTTPTDEGKDVKVYCKADPVRLRSCILNLKVPAGKQYYVRLAAIYKEANVALQPVSGASLPGTEQQAQDVQVKVDSTGKAADVYRRVQARIPLNNSYDWPTYIVHSMENMCKQFYVAPNYFDPAGCGANYNQ